jgi:hypothetical protein
MWKPLSLRKKQHYRNNTREETMGQKDGMEREQVIACTMVEHAFSTGQKTAYLCQGCGGWRKSAMREPLIHA